jgi:hypothetical protein
MGGLPGEGDAGIFILSIGQHSIEHFVVVGESCIEQAHASRVSDSQICLILFVSRHASTVTRIHSPAAVSSHQPTGTLDPRLNVVPKLSFQ